MECEILGRKQNVLVRRQRLMPGQSSPWHTDPLHRFTTVLSGTEITIEFRDGGEKIAVPVHAGLCDWDVPEPRVHRAVNTGSEVYEEIVVFLLGDENDDPQPVASTG